MAEPGTEEQSSLSGVGHQRFGREEQVPQPDCLGRRGDAPSVLERVGRGDDVTGGADPAQPGGRRNRIVWRPADQDHLVAPVHRPLTPCRGDAAVLVRPSRCGGRPHYGALPRAERSWLTASTSPAVCPRSWGTSHLCTPCSACRSGAVCRSPDTLNWAGRGGPSAPGRVDPDPREHRSNAHLMAVHLRVGRYRAPGESDHGHARAGAPLGGQEPAGSIKGELQPDRSTGVGRLSLPSPSRQRTLPSPVHSQLARTVTG